MLYEIVTYPIDNIEVRNELSYVIEYFTQKGISSCNVLFGYAWGIEYYPTKHWEYEEIQLSNLISKIESVQNSGLGSIGKDDVFIKISGLEFRFCNDSDIHISYSQLNSDVEHFYSRWKEAGYQPSEWLKKQEKGPGECLRKN